MAAHPGVHPLEVCREREAGHTDSPLPNQIYDNSIFLASLFRSSMGCRYTGNPLKSLCVLLEGNYYSVDLF
jgi:hypothetical protein